MNGPFSRGRSRYVIFLWLGRSVKFKQILLQYPGYLEGSPSGLWRSLGKRVGCKPSRVRIPLPPPDIIFLGVRTGSFLFYESKIGPKQEEAVAGELKNKPESYWRERLTPEEYHVLREGGTERPGTGALLYNKETGIYRCAACEQELFSSDTKYDSGSGWPSFYDVVAKENVEYHDDSSGGMKRVEVACSRCGSHLGHVFPDGPRETTGQRYCIDSIALDFKAKE